MGKKKVLFMITSLNMGGIETSLLNFLERLDQTKYDVELLCVQEGGVLLERLPAYVTLSAIPQGERDYFESTKANKGSALKKIEMLYGSMMQRLAGKGLASGGAWSVYKKHIAPWNKRYDVAVAYADGFCREYVADKVQAKKKIVWQHFDYHWFDKFQKLDAITYAKFDQIVAVSEVCKASLVEAFPDLSERMKVIYNIINEERVLQLSSEEVEESFLTEETAFKICTVGRLSREKNIIFAVEVMKELKQRGCNCLWYVAGDGPKREEIQKCIMDNGLEQYFYLLGTTPNPYKYMKAADIYVQPSIFEGMSVSVTEAKFLKKCILTSDIPSFREQLCEESILPLEVAKFADRIEKLAQCNEKLEVDYTMKYKDSLKAIEEILDHEAAR